MISRRDSFVDKKPAYLVLKQECLDEILQKAERKYPNGHIAGTVETLETEYNLKVSKDTVRRIFRGKSVRYITVESFCDSYGFDCDDVALPASRNPPDLGDEFKELQKKTNIPVLTADLCSRITFQFEEETHAYGFETSAEWLTRNFIDFDVAVVSSLPSEYPASRELLLQARASGDDSFFTSARVLNGSATTSTEALKKYEKVLLYGEPGSGKSSYLRWVALQCRDGKLLADYVPLFLEVSQFSVRSEMSTLTTYFELMFESWGAERSDLTQILADGKGLFIVDGIDEISPSEQQRFSLLLRQLLDTYRNCRFLISSRLAFKIKLSKTFQKVILLPLHPRKHVPLFVESWFYRHEKGAERAYSMLEKLKNREYRQIKDIASRPVLLRLLCHLFENFNNFPKSRANVFYEGIDLLVRQSTPHIETNISEQPRLYPNDVINILCRIAYYFFVTLDRQTLFHTRDVSRVIQEYCVDTYKVDKNTVNGDHILRGIEHFNGLLVKRAKSFCAFSHLTYQEYFVAQHFVSENEEKDVFKKITDPSWKFVIELVAELLMPDKTHDFFEQFKLYIDGLIGADTELTEFFRVLDRAASLTSLVSNENRLSFIIRSRAWYLAHAIDEDAGQMSVVTQKSDDLCLPDILYAASSVDSKILGIHAIAYKAYHCTSQEKSERLEVHIKQLIKSFRSVNDRKISMLKGWQDLIELQQSKLKNDKDEWWKEKRLYWQGKIKTFMNDLDIPCTYHLDKEKVSILRKYYDATFLFSNCISRANISQEKYKELASLMLSLTHVSQDGSIWNSGRSVG